MVRFGEVDLVWHRMGGVLRSHVCRARVVRLELEFVAAGAAGKMTFAVAGIRQLQDEVIASRRAA